MFYDRQPGLALIEAELNLPAAMVQIYQFDLIEQMHRTLREDHAYRLDLSLSPRLPGTGLCFADHWSSRRFEQPGQLFLLPPGETLNVRNGIGRQGAIICRLPAGTIHESFEGNFEWTDQRLEASLNINSLPISNLLLQLGEEARHPGFASAVLSEAIAIQIAVYLQRYYRGVEKNPAPGGLTPRRLRLIDERLREMEHPPVLSELASLCKLSVRQLSRAFRASRGISIGEHVARYRFAHAMRLLGEGGSVKSVAYAMGFASPSSFSYAFRKATGMAPNQYRDQTRA